MYCPRCGEDNPSGVSRCCKCGVQMAGYSVDGPSGADQWRPGGYYLELKHSGFGIASVIVSILSIVLLLGVIGFFTYMEFNGVSVDRMSDDDPALLLAGIVFLVALIMNALALAFGISGLFQRDRKKVFAALGIVFSGGFLAVLFFLVILGSVV